MSKTIDQALREAGFTAKVRKTKGGKKWPRKRGRGPITITITTNREFKPGTGFAFQFIAVEESK